MEARGAHSQDQGASMGASHSATGWTRRGQRFNTGGSVQEGPLRNPVFCRRGAPKYDMLT